MSGIDEKYEEFMKVEKLFKRRNKFIMHNNYCILETVAFYENIFLNDIIKPFIFNNNYDKYIEISSLICDRLNFMDRFKIVKKIGKLYDITDFKNFDKFIEMRNKIAHNLSSVCSLDIENKQTQLIFGGKVITWENYLNLLKEWASLSYKLSRFTREIFSKLNSSKLFATFVYCKIEENCVLVQHNLIFPKPDNEYTSFLKNGFDMDLIQYLKEEREYNKENKSSK